MYAEVMAWNRSRPAIALKSVSSSFAEANIAQVLEDAPKKGSPVSQICALIIFPSISLVRVANSTPIIDFESKLNSFRVNRDRTDINDS